MGVFLVFFQQIHGRGAFANTFGTNCIPFTKARRLLDTTLLSINTGGNAPILGTRRDIPGMKQGCVLPTCVDGNEPSLIVTHP
jgi:hypothetical protein